MPDLPPILSRAAVRAADRRAVELLGLPTALLMENAGRGLADVTQGETRRYGRTSVAVVAARGNNGGDGLVAARHLALRRIQVRVLLASPAVTFTEDSDPGRNLRAVLSLGIPVDDASDGPRLGAAAASLGHRALLVDAVLGTGLDGPVRGHLRAVLAWMGTSGLPVVAADLPSGVDADTGELLGPAPRCTATATFLAMKPGLLRGPGAALAGRITICDIGVPAGAVAPGARRA